MAENGKELVIPETCSDRLSDLPDDLIHYILSFLPLKTIVGTSILSKEWKNKWKELWVSSAKLEFGSNFAPSLRRQGYADFVEKILKLHVGVWIQKFQLYFYPGSEYTSATREWVELALAKGVEELDLNFRGSVAPRNIHLDIITDQSSNFQYLPESFYSSSSLTFLTLSYCSFLPPPNSTGFRSLKCVTLKLVNVSGHSIAALLNNSPVLEELAIVSCGPLEATRINSHQLKYLTIDSCWDDDYIEVSTPNLQELQFITQLSETPKLRDISSVVHAVVHVVDESELLSGVFWLSFLSCLSHVITLSLILQPYPVISLLLLYFHR